MKLLTKHYPLITTAAAVLILSSLFFIRPFAVTGGSMEPTYGEGDVLVVESLTPHMYIWRGEVLVIRNPHDKSVTEIKRVIGLPNETVEVGSDGVTINPGCSRGALEALKGAPCNISFAAGTLVGGTGNGTFRIKLGPEDYMVLGDNRSKSSDSRTFGAVQQPDIIGHVLFTL